MLSTKFKCLCVTAYVFLSNESLLMRLYEGYLKYLRALLKKTYYLHAYCKYLHSPWFLDGRTSMLVYKLQSELMRCVSSKLALN